jgi:SAM-dependent methyltransferase
MNPKSGLRRMFPTARRLLVERSLRNVDTSGRKSILVVGAGHDPYRFLFKDAIKYVKLDIEQYGDPEVIKGDAHDMPFANGEFDALLATEVMEHLRNPFLFAKEAGRVLAQGGLLILTVPFLFHQHADPFDYWRPTKQTLLDLFGSEFQIVITGQGNRLHVISDLLTTSFSPSPLLQPLRVFNHLLARVPGSMRRSECPSSSPSGFLLVGTKR